MTAAELVRRLTAQGIRLSVWEGELRYRGPKEAVTQEVLAALKRHKAILVSYLNPRAKPIPWLLAHLADRGVWIALDETGHPRFQRHEDADLDGVDEAVIGELHARADELVAWLKKPVKELTDAELEALGYRRPLPDRVLDEMLEDLAEPDAHEAREEGTR